MRIFCLIAGMLFNSGAAQTVYSVGDISSIIAAVNNSSQNASKLTQKQKNSTMVQIPIFPKVMLQKVQQNIQPKQQLSIIDSIKLLTDILISSNKQISTPVRSTESLVTKLPKKDQLTKLVQDGDIAGISSLLQVLSADDSIPCRIKLLYLVQMQQMTKVSVKRKTQAADQLNFTITSTKQEIAIIRQEINLKQKDINITQINQLEKAVKNNTLNIADLSHRINVVQDQIKPQQAKILQFQSQLEGLQKQNQLQISKISSNNLKILKNQSILRDLTQKLAVARESRQRQLASIASSQNLIKQNLRGIDKIKLQSTEARNKIKLLQNAQDNLQRQISFTEIDIRRARSDLSTAKSRDIRQSSLQKKHQSKIDEYQPYLSDINVIKVRDMVANLNDTIPYINININRLYYYCYGLGLVKTEEKASVIVYVVKGQSFGQYIQNAYAQIISVPKLIITDDLRLQLVDPNSQQWSAKYGYPTISSFQNNTQTKCPRNISYFGFESNSGIIQKVSGNTIVVSGGDDNMFQLNIGQCTRIQSTTSIPEIGQNIVWKGSFASQDRRSYNIQAATCW